MRYLPHTRDDVESMLRTIGVKDIDDLFAVVPEECRRTKALDLPGPLTEWELVDRMAELSKTMAVSPEYQVYVGAGCYERFIPASVSYLAGRSEFSTSYTPYQPEMSQGTLQAIFEYQTLVSRLLGMEVANASHYDGASALAEALLMAVRTTRRDRVAVSKAAHPLYRSVARTYFSSAGYEIIELPYLPDGRTDLTGLDAMEDVAGVAIQSPNFFGCIEDLGAAAQAAHERGALMIASFSDPLAYGLLKSPGSLAADIACGEGRSFGIDQSFGGPGLGMFATSMKRVRDMPGRLVGQSVDAEGRRAFVLTLATREQHIRRERATSNICTNNNLCAVIAAMYMASLGRVGLRELAALNHDKAEYLKSGLAGVGCRLPFSGSTFNEFVVEYPGDPDETYRRLLEKKIVPGLDLGPYYPELSGKCLLCVTEVRTKDQMDDFVREIAL